MKKNINLVLACSALVFFVLAFWINDPYSWFSVSLEKSKSLLSLHFDQLEHIKVYKKKKLQYSLVREDDQWHILQDGKKYIADSVSIQESFQPFFELKKFHLVSNDKNFSLDENNWAISFESSSQKNKIFVKQNSHTFFRLELENKVYSHSKLLLTAVQKPINYFRDKRVVHIEKENIANIVFKSKRFHWNVSQKNNFWYATDNPKEILNQTFAQILEDFMQSKGNDFLEIKEFLLLKTMAHFSLLSKSQTSFTIVVKDFSTNFYAVQVNQNQPLKIKRYVFDNLLQPLETWLQDK